MEEILVVDEVETLPEVETEEATPTSTETVDDTEVAEEPTTANGEQEQTEDATPPEEAALHVKFNKQIHSLSRDDAVSYAQKGMKYDTISPLLDTLKRVAAAEGKTLAELVEAISQQNEETMFQRLMDRCGDEEIARELLEVEKGKHQKAYERLIESEKTEEQESEDAVTQRMAAEFDELRREFPQFSSFDKVPKSVVKEAVEKGTTLLDAQLRYEHRQRVKAEQARASQASAEKASTGSQNSDGAEVRPPEVEAFMKGLWG